MRLYSNSSKYSQTCLYDHLYKMTTHLGQPMLSPPNSHAIVNVSDNDLSNMTSDQFFCPQNEKKNMPSKTMARKAKK